MSVFKQVCNSIAVMGLLFSLSLAPVYGQQPQVKAQPKKPNAEAQPGHNAPGVNETYVLQTYEVGDLIINVQDHPYIDQLSRESAKAATGVGGGNGFGGGGGGLGGGAGGGGGGGVFSVPFGQSNQQRDRSPIATKSGLVMLCQFGGGGGGAPTAKETAQASASNVSMDDLIRVLINTVDANSWLQNGGEGRVEPLGTALVVHQTPSVHHLIVELLDQLRRPADNRRTLTIDARWLMLSSDDLDALLTKDTNGVPTADRKALAAFTRRTGSIRGLTNCFSGQLVYLTSGTNRNVVSGWIPVVGAIGTSDGAASLASAHGKPQIRFVAETSEINVGRQSRVGYQPIIGSSNLGALLEIRPTMIGSTNLAVVELRSTLTAPAERATAPSGNTATDALAPAIDRVAVETLQLATSLRMELGKPIVVGGMTYMPSSAKAREEADKAERQQLYLVLEIR